jgi:hypothetical protein
VRPFLKKTKIKPGTGGFTPVMLATSEVEIRRVEVLGQPKQIA